MLSFMIQNVSAGR